MTGATNHSDQLVQDLQRKGVFFFLPKPSLYHLSICLAEGFEELAIPISANVDYYQRPYDPNGKLLFRREFNHDQAGLVIADLDTLDVGLDTDSVYKLLDPLRVLRAVVCMADLNYTYFEASSKFPTFITHKSKFINAPGWRMPWAFGLSRDSMTKIEAALSVGRPRRPAFIRDFRPSFNQDVRNSLDLAFVPALSRNFQIDRTVDGEGRFLFPYYERLSSAAGCLAYGGEFIANVSQREYLRGALRISMEGPGPYIVRWDSWRFWESLAAGCVTVALDFGEYGLELPVTPTNGVHYIGLRFDRLREAIEFLTSQKDKFQEIGNAGRVWALQHYSPKATATRFIEQLAKVPVTWLRALAALYSDAK